MSDKPAARRIVIVGTGTDVGKSVLSLLIMQTLLAQGHNPLYLKPFQTGCRHAQGPDTDAGFVHQNVPELSGFDPAYSIIHCHENPKAPYFAARDMGQHIDIDDTLLQIQEKEQAGLNCKNISHLVIEGSGGLMVPLTRDKTMLDFIAALDTRPVIAAHAGLGTINHTLLTVQCLEDRGIKPAGVVFLDSPKEETAPDLISENMEAVTSFSSVKVLGLIPGISDFSTLYKDCSKIAGKIIDTL